MTKTLLYMLTASGLGLFASSTIPGLVEVAKYLPLGQMQTQTRVLDKNMEIAIVRDSLDLTNYELFVKQKDIFYVVKCSYDSGKLVGIGVERFVEKPKMNEPVAFDEPPTHDSLETTCRKANNNFNLINPSE